MTRQALTLKRVAQLIRKAAAAENAYSQVHEQLVSKWRTGQFIPNPSHLRWLAHALEVPVEMLTGAAEEQRIYRGGVLARPALVRHDLVDRERFARLRYTRVPDDATLDLLDTVADQYAHEIWVAPARTILPPAGAIRQSYGCYSRSGRAPNNRAD